MAEVDTRAWEEPAIFRLIRQRGAIEQDEMFRAFNMGIGLVVACAAGDGDRVINMLAGAGEPKARRIGQIVSGDRVVRYT
jgi:phosphoribosylformylglycinamidine cyclo-ligase